MKKKLAWLLAAAMCISLTACGGGGDSGGSSNADGGNGGAQKGEQTVELTLDNWSDFIEFPLVVTAKRDSFDQLEGVYCEYHIRLNPAVAGRVKQFNDVAIAYEFTGGQDARFVFDADTGEVELLEFLPESVEYRDYHESGDAKVYLMGLEEGHQFIPMVLGFDEVVEGSTVTFTTCAFESIAITRIQGSVTLAG